MMVFILYPQAVISGFIGTKYLPASGALIILSLAMFSRILVGPNSETARAIDLPKIDLKSSIGGININIILNILLVPVFGIAGAAFATLLGYLVYNLSVNTFIYKYINIHPFSIDLFKVLAFTFTLCLLSRIIIGSDITLTNLIFLGIIIEIIQVVFIANRGIFGPMEEDIAKDIFNKLSG
jgi:O-antigen/teichoic acid export membrane protein